MKLCQIESFTRRSTSPRRDDMLLVLCLGNNVKSSLTLEEANIHICIPNQHACCQTLLWIKKIDKKKDMALSDSLEDRRPFFEKDLDKKPSYKTVKVLFPLVSTWLMKTAPDPDKLWVVSVGGQCTGAVTLTGLTLTICNVMSHFGI